jgi:hypothetical protein
LETETLSTFLRCGNEETDVLKLLILKKSAHFHKRFSKHPKFEIPANNKRFRGEVSGHREKIFQLKFHKNVCHVTL